MIFKTNKALIEQVKDCVAAFDKTFVHGDGNIYDNQRDSDFRKGFSNPGNEEAKYRLILEKGASVPGTVEDFNKALLDARNKELVQDAAPKTASAVKTIPQRAKVSKGRGDKDGNTETVDTGKGADKAKAEDNV
jgi:hypothetical protein